MILRMIMSTQEQADKTQTFFVKDDGTPVPAVSREALYGAILSTWERCGLSPLQSAEAASFSFAMVVRFALGLSAQGGLICAVVRPTFTGAIALACLRHLTNAGAETVALVINDDEQRESTEAFASALATCESIGVQIEQLSTESQLAGAKEVCSACHNILFGTAELSNLTIAPRILDTLVEMLNEESTPVHCVLAPHGIDLDSTSGGTPSGELLFASSTISLGAPLDILAKQEDCVGRHYLADLSLPPDEYLKLSPEFPYLFHEQPVIKLLQPATEEE